MSTASRPEQHSLEPRWLAFAVGTRTAERSVDLVLLVVRIVLAWIFIYYGGGKLFGWFNGPGFHQTALFMADTAHLHPGDFFAAFGGLIELGGGVAIGVGIASRLAGLALFADMVIAIITVTWSRGINSEKVPPGYELNVTLAALALVVVVLGAGRYSVDAVIERRLRSAGT
jgi:putative oxidoreductase